MKKYNAKINGTMYEIEIELVKENSGRTISQPSVPPQAGSGQAPVRPAIVREPAPKPVQAENKSAVGTGERDQVCAPMPGTILSVKITQGAVVKKGQVLLTLEAMKMENEIIAQNNGVVESVNVTEGAAVETGTLLCVIQS